ncbi:DUF134 domain-containing protein [Alkalibacter rhizosphaerae]|uniref:UPF0251 protein J0B03_04665 n=1 Tax=Alkalibacter rhizosphaerae TaxID=2815577 RepID=A0A974XGD2_9FIRM|nr:DUF134 domain-containing protein [Alkalibacter rhizosphaerae]QSX09362.1 DUF134 domain-containing protein [Alkalibacter rhizosphaerae]
MPRPIKWRRVCGVPDSKRFGPMDASGNMLEPVIMTVDEYETIRLIDLEGLMQEDCANQMNVARTTVQRIYNEARKKLAQSLVEGRVLRIEGGEYRICEDVDRPGCGYCRRRRVEDNENRNTGK